MNVRVVHAQPERDCGTGEYLAVRAAADPSDETVRLVTIQRFVEKTRLRDSDDDHWTVRTLILDQKMSPDEAVCFATCYAERKNIPVVYDETT